MKIDFSEAEINYLYQAMECNYVTLHNDYDDWKSDTYPEKIKQKLIATFKINADNLSSYRGSRYWESNHFGCRLFLGNGIHSMNEASIAHKRLSYAIMMLGGLQQSGRSETKEQVEQEKLYAKDGEQKIKAALKDIIAAFGYTPEDLNV